MSSTRSSLLSRSSFPLLAALLAACGSGNDLSEPGNTTVAGVTLSPDTATLPVGDSLRLTATAHAADGTAVADAAIDWTSSTPAVATVAGGLVRALAVGTSRIVATSGGHADTAMVTVTGASGGVGGTGPAARLVIAPHPDTLAQGDSLQLVASVTDSAGHPLPGATVAWSSSDSSAVSVSAAGLVRARTGGLARIAAVTGALHDSSTIVVRAGATPGGVAARIQIVPPTPATLTPDHCAEYSALVYDSAGIGLPRATVAWTSSDSTIAGVTAVVDSASARATICGRRAGTATVRATSGAVSDSLSATVNALPTTTRIALGTLGGATSGAVDVNASEVVVGWSDLAAGGAHAFRWTEAGGMQDLGTLGDSSIATAINDAGYIAGTSRTAAGERHVVLWTPAGQLQDLGVPPVSFGTIEGVAVNDINEQNVVVGNACGSPGGNYTCTAFTWDATRGFDTLPITSSRVTATGINDAGDIVGEVLDVAAFRLDVYLLPAGGTARNLGAGENDHWAFAAAVNAGRQIAGSDEPALSNTWPNFWSDSTGFVPVRPLSQFDEVAWGYGTDLNARGEVVGFGDTGAFYWTQKGGFVVFDGAGTAAAISDSGTVVGEHERVAALWRGVSGATAASLSPSLRVASLFRSGARSSAVRKCLHDHWTEGRARLATCRR